MTDSAKRDRGKRERLVAGAGDLVHRQGVLGVTLAQVAETAHVPPGNVYYYFKTKDDLLRAVVEARIGEVRAMLHSFDAHADPSVRLKELAGRWVEMRDLVARYGCPLGTLSEELGRRDDGLDREAAQLMGLILDWAEAQFRQLNAADPRECAVTLLAGVQGGALLAHALRDPSLLADHVRRLQEWIDSLL
ncbi:TetR/AcrR family transcriptional regulator [Streptomyces sp. S.PB5]|uniref:TetR/AcrR family transcriptional regulator n=1 Tax=Streptomyces sp. S.PB5 TaxID=3020844 RepID=UPI0025B14123|nr:TetR/AcrR family transcriptional regulator [Streptomyces sp. S.PB5]MDN3029334.1 TetR/AcrR family transcriptional regulator [Streptomyces sp. S.PB5]